MQIVVKALAEHLSDASEIIRKSVLASLQGRDLGPDAVRRVFPDLTQGQRARLFVLELPDDLSSEEIDGLMARLRALTALEYAEIPAPRRPSSRKAPTRRR